jgi:hypothetical protein
MPVTATFILAAYKYSFAHDKVSAVVFVGAYSAPIQPR